MKMEELLSAADEMELKHKHSKHKVSAGGKRGGDHHDHDHEEEDDDHEADQDQDHDEGSPSSPSAPKTSSGHAPLPSHATPGKANLPPTSSSSSSPSPSPSTASSRNTIRTRSKKENPPPLNIDHDLDNDSQTVPDSSPRKTSPSSSPSSSSPPSAPSSTSSSAAAEGAKKQCKTVGCVVCAKGPPPSFTKGTPIWAQILHLVLYALTESAKVNVMGSPKMKVKRYFHLRDDIYEYISIHWDVICRRERIKNWRHTIGMTLSHYQNLFQNGYHIYQNTGYWSMKDNVPSPYVIDPLIGEGASPGKKRKYSHSSKPSIPQDKEKDSSSALTPFISDFSISPSVNSAHNISMPSNDDEKNKNKMKRLDLDGHEGLLRSDSESRKALHNSLLAHSSQAHAHVSVTQANDPRLPQGARFDEMKGAIDKFKREMADIQAEIDSLQEQLQVKKAEEHLLKFLQEGISSFRDKIKNRIDLLKTEMINNHSEHQMQMHSMASELATEKNNYNLVYFPPYLKYVPHGW